MPSSPPGQVLSKILSTPGELVINEPSTAKSERKQVPNMSVLVINAHPNDEYWAVLVGQVAQVSSGKSDWSHSYVQKVDGSNFLLLLSKFVSRQTIRQTTNYLSKDKFLGPCNEKAEIETWWFVNQVIEIYFQQELHTEQFLYFNS